jgi:hypothetical protein
MTEHIRRIRIALATTNVGIRSLGHGGFLGDVNMCRGWKGLALVAACWWLSVPAQAQDGTYPSPVGAARMPEPIPCTPSPTPPAPQPNLIPGPISPQAAPMGPPDSLSLPYDHSNAFQCENYVKENFFYASLGPIALQRNHLGAGDIAVVNARAVGMDTGPVIPNPFLPAPPGVNSALNFNSVTPALSLGLTGTAGYLWGGNQAIEITSFYIWENDVTASATQPFALDTLFYNPPLTFLGEGLFRDANQVNFTQGSSLFNVEANYRRWNSAFAGLDFIFGVRYMRQNEFLNIMSSGTAIFANSFGLPTPGTDMMMYQVIAHNNIMAPQLGMEYNLPCGRYLTLSGMGKVALGANYITTDVSLNRSDGLTAFNTQRTDWSFGQIYQLGAFADINILERLRLRLGYTSMWLNGVATSVDQVDFNLKGFEARQAFGLNGVAKAIETGSLQNINNAQQSIPHGRFNDRGSMIYFGPLVEMQFCF